MTTAASIQPPTQPSPPAVAYYGPDGAVVIRRGAEADVGKAVASFLDLLGTATGRATFYNSKAEQDAAEAAAHDAVWSVNRGLYGALLTLPGVTDRGRQLGLIRLLDQPRRPNDPSFLDEQHERQLLRLLVDGLPPPRLLRTFVDMAEKRVNNRRSRRLILTAIFSRPDRLPLWAVKYRDKLATALRHALGRGVANGVAKMAAAIDARASGSARMARHVDPFLPTGANRAVVYECLAYILGRPKEGGWTVPMIRAFYAARTDLAAGAILPPEVLEGIRSRYHKSTPAAQVLKIAVEADTFTEGQKLARDRSAKAKGVDLGFDPSQQDMVKLYVHALETGTFLPAVRTALDQKAAATAATLSVRYARVGVVLDQSASMAGVGEQKWRPLAVALAMRDVLAASADEWCRVETVGGTPPPAGVVSVTPPSGETNLAAATARALAGEPDAVYILSDGYENAPAGRVHEVVLAARKLGCRTPVFQVSPVSGAEAVGVRRLSDEIAPMPVFRPEALGLASVRAALAQDPAAGIQALLAATRPAIRTLEVFA